MRYKKSLLVSIILICVFFISSNISNINIQWIKCYGGFLGEEPLDLIQLDNGDMIIISLTKSFDGDVGKIYGEKYVDVNIFIYRINKNGTIIWKKIIGGSNYDTVNNIILINKNEFLIYGKTYSNDYDMEESGLKDKSKISSTFIFIMDEAGNILNKIFCKDNFKNGIRKIEKFNNGFIIQSQSSSYSNQIGFYSYNNGFIPIWEKELNPRDLFYTDGYFIYIINNKTVDKIDQYDKNGNLIKTVPIKQGDFSFPYFYQIKLVNNYLMFSFENQIKLVDMDGNIVFEKKIEPKSPYNKNYISDIIFYNQNQFIIVTNNWYDDGEERDEYNLDICIMVMDKKGNILKEEYIKGNWVDSAKYLYPLSDHEFLLLGQTNSTGGDIQGAHVDYNISEMGNDKDILIVKFSIE